ncbi:MAG: hypothetical protein GY856_17045 [bacterium]|nr:hypothetical protein [bacterium]
MTDVIESMLRFSWSMSLYSARQAGTIVSALATARSPRQAAIAFDAVTDAAEGELGERLGDTFRTVDGWQQDAFEAVYRIGEPALAMARSLAAANVVRGTVGVLQRSAEILEAAWPGDGGVIWRELRNRLEAFEHFQYVHAILRLPDPADAELVKSVDKTSRLDRYRRLWATEGLGYAHAEAAWDGAAAPRDLLRRSQLDELPVRVLIPLHTGAGLALARRMQPAMESHLPAADIGAGVERFAEICEQNARPGYAEAMFEALGLIARNLDPDTIPEIDRQLERLDSRRVATFWHGVGRGLYFAATQVLVPGSTWRAVEKTRSEPPHELGRLNALAGLAWAFALTNVRHPEILEDFLHDHGADLTAAECAAFAHGTASAIVLWYDFAGRDDHLDRFLSHRPDRSETERWDRLVTTPCEQVLREAKKTGPDTDETFRYRPPAEV